MHVRAAADKPETASGSDDAGSGKGGFQMPGFLKPLTDFGVGKKSVWEGGVGLFVITGIGATPEQPLLALSSSERVLVGSLSASLHVQA